jgi:uncharacterized Zn-binding protein involved in type VI secretion
MALKKIVLNGDQVKHGTRVSGAVASGATKSKAEGKLIVRHNDAALCDGISNSGTVHSGGVYFVIATSTTVSVEGQKIARHLDQLTCGAIIQASATVSSAG